MDCCVEPGVQVDFSTAVRAHSEAPMLRVFAAGRLEDGRRYFMVEVCDRTGSPTLENKRRRWWVRLALVALLIGLPLPFLLHEPAIDLRTEAHVVVQPPRFAPEVPPPRVVVIPPVAAPETVAPAPGPPPPVRPKVRKPPRSIHDLEPW